MKGDLMFYCPYYLENLRQVPYDSYIRVFHASPDAPAVDVYINGKPEIRGLKYKSFSDYIALKPGPYNVQVFAAGTTTNPVISTRIEMPASRIFTAAAIGKLANISLYLIPDPRTPRKPGRAMLRFVHLSPDAPPVNLAIANGKTLFSNIPYKGITDYTTLMPGKYNFELNLAQNGKRVLWVPNIRIMPHRNYSIYAVGLAGGQPPLQVVIPLDGSTYLKMRED